MKELELPTITGMGGWYIPSEICDDMINVFEDNSIEHGRGECGNYDDDGYGVNLDTKDSYELSISSKLKIKPFADYHRHLEKCLDKYIERYKYINYIKRFSCNEDYNIQKYLPNGGFKKWHFENEVMDKRVLVFMTYLNDVTDAGGTEFLYQNLTTPAEKGLTIIWPAGFTHVHKGIVSPTQTKYIATGWYSFE